MSNRESETSSKNTGKKAKRATGRKKKTTSSRGTTGTGRRPKRPRSSAKKATTKPRTKKATIVASDRKVAKPADVAGPTLSREVLRIVVTQEQRHAMIAEAAYYKAQARDFAAGDVLRDWTEAEAEIDAAIFRGTIIEE